MESCNYVAGYTYLGKSCGLLSSLVELGLNFVAILMVKYDRKIEVCFFLDCCALYILAGIGSIDGDTCFLFSITSGIYLEDEEANSLLGMQHAFAGDRCLAFTAKVTLCALVGMQ